MEELNIESLSPKVHEKYSENLYKFLKRRGLKSPQKVFIDENSDFWIGYFYDNDFIGSRLMNVLTNDQTSTWCFSSKNTPKLNLSEFFWRDYEKIGRCAIDRNHQIHFLKSDSRYKEEGDTRVCQWCGHKQKLRKWTETIERSEWINA